MSRTTGNQRNQLGGRRDFQPEFGARHPVVFDTTIRRLFGDLDYAWSQILPERIEADDAGREHYRPQFHLYDDRDQIGMTVMERRLSAEHARNKRLRWNPNDVGRTKGRIEDEIGRLGIDHLITSQGTVAVDLTDVLRVGNASGKNGERKLAAIVDQSSPAAELLVREHEIVVEGLGIALKGFRYPYSEYVPKLTLGRIFKEVPPRQLDACVEAAQALLPATIEIEPLRFFAHQEL